MQVLAFVRSEDRTDRDKIAAGFWNLGILRKGISDNNKRAGREWRQVGAALA